MEVPRRLRELNQWICWRFGGPKSKPTKMPIDPATGRAASTSDPNTWATFAGASAASSKYAGLGFVFQSGGDLFGIDLDGCIHPDGSVSPWAMEILERFQTYSEVSPSGTGIKLYARGKFSGSGRQKEMGDETVGGKSPKLELYPGDKSRYFAFTGQRFGDVQDVTDCQASLDALIAEHFPARKRQSMTFIPKGDGAEERASAYLSKIDPTVCGTGSCHNRTFRAACNLVIGFGLSVDQAFPLLSAWAARGEHSWSDKELLHKLHDADKEDGDRGFRLAGREYQGGNVDLSRLLNNLSEAQRDVDLTSPKDPHAFPRECIADIPGLIGEVMDHNLATSMYPQPELALAGALALMSVLTGRKVADHYGTRTNCYIVGLALSGAGKERARQVNQDILCRSGGEKMYGNEGLASSAGLISATEESPAILFQLDEINHLMATMQNPSKSPHLYAIGAELLKLYSKSGAIYKGAAYADMSRVKIIDQPHVVIYGTAVPKSFWETLTSENVSEGLLGRFMIFESPGYVPREDVGIADAPQSIIDQAAWWVSLSGLGGNLNGHHPRPHIAEYDQDAKDRLSDHQNAICYKRIVEESDRAALWSRSGEKTSKLSLLFACSRTTEMPVRVRLEDVERAIKINNWLTRKMLRKVFLHVSENDQESKVKRVLRILEKKMTLSQFTRKTQWLRFQERRDIIFDLVQSGEIACVETETSGRKVTHLHRVSDPPPLFQDNALNSIERSPREEPGDLLSSEFKSAP